MRVDGSRLSLASLLVSALFMTSCGWLGPSGVTWSYRFEDVDGMRRWTQTA